MALLTNESPRKYDPEIVRAWGSLLASIGHAESDFEGSGQRAYPRARFHLRARVHVLKLATNGWAEGNQLPVICHNLSRGGIGFLCQMPLPVGQHVRAFVRLQAGENWVFEGQIARCRTHDDGWSDMGIQFANLTGTANRRIEPNPTDNTA